MNWRPRIMAWRVRWNQWINRNEEDPGLTRARRRYQDWLKRRG